MVKNQNPFQTPSLLSPQMTSTYQNENRYNHILQKLERYQKKDFTFSSGRILGSMCTQPHPIAKEAYVRFLETNLGDPQLFPGTKEIESQVINFVTELLQAPSTAGGNIVSGGTEGNITAMWLAKQLTRNKEIIIPRSAHFSFSKIASLMDMKLRIIPLTPSYIMDWTKIKEHITKNTAAIVGVAGSTELGTIDPIPEISDICADEHIFLHVDAAFGGFIIPFLKQMRYPVPDFDFSLPGVSSISVDFHKMGYSAIPLGILIFRNHQWLDEISIESPCISSEKQAGILGTRSGGPVAAAYAVLHYLGRDGYMELVQRCMVTTAYLQQRISELGLSLVVQPVMNVLGVKFKNPNRIVHKLDEYGWRVNKIDHLSCIRLVVMPHVTQDVIDDFIPVLKQTCEEVGEL